MTTVRLVFWGGSREVNDDRSQNDYAKSDNSAFQFAANNVSRDYEDWARVGRKIKLRCANNMVAQINAVAKGDLASLDILSHGTS